VATATAAEPVDDSVAVTYSVNRAEKQVSSPVSCTLDGGPTACGAVTGSAKKLTSYALNLTNLADGEHAFAVTFTLTDGGSATAAALFTIDTGPTLEEACADSGGVLTENTADGQLWLCLADPYLGQQPAPGLDVFDLMDNWVEAFYSYCPQTIIPSAFFANEFLGAIAAMQVECRPNAG
jgi:hypothetical protein